MNITTRRVAPFVAVAAMAAALTACGGGDDAASDNAPVAGSSTAAVAGSSVSVKGLAFNPPTLKVAAGTTVTWTDDESITHTVTSGAVTGVAPTTGLRSGQTPDGTFDGRLNSKDAKFSFTFTKPGTYSYFCSIHQGMNAQVVVDAT